MITEASASRQDINNVIVRLESVLADIPREHIIIACLSLAVAAEKPDLTEEELVNAVEGASRWICLFLADVNDQLEPNQVN